MIKNIFGFLGGILNSLYYILSAKSFLKLCNKSNNNLEDINFYKILFNYLASFFSYFYSDYNCYSPLIICSKFGFSFGLILVGIYVLFEYKIDFTDSILNILMISIFSMTYKHYFDNIAIGEYIYGYYFIFSHLISLFYILYENYFEYKNKIHISFSHNLNIIYTLTAFFWLIYGFLNDDYYIIITFGIELLFGSLLIIFNIYYKKICEDYTGIRNVTNENMSSNHNMNGNAIEFGEDKIKYENI